MRIYKILPRAEWTVAVAAGRFEGSAVDHQDGYIHLSTAAQAGETARRYFAGIADLVVCLLAPPALPSVGECYPEFTETTDELETAPWGG